MKSISASFTSEYKQYRVSSNLLFLLSLSPLLILLFLAILLLIPASHNFAQWLLTENRPVELLTFIMALWAAFESLKLTQKCSRKNYKLAMLFYLCFSFLFFFLAMEEISWGQHFFKFTTPEFWRIRNAQDELNLHNYDFIGVNYLEVYPLAFGVVGIIGIWANLTQRLPKIICPPLILWSWFAIITIHSGIDLFHEFYIVNIGFDDLVNHLDEAAEMLVAIAGLLYIYFNSRLFLYRPTHID